MNKTTITTTPIKDVNEILEQIKNNVESSKKEPKLYVISLVEMDYLASIQQENEKLKKSVNHKHKYASEMEGKYILEKAKLDQLRSWLEKMLDDGNDIFSVIRVKDVLSKLNELEKVKDEKV